MAKYLLVVKPHSFYAKLLTKPLSSCFVPIMSMDYTKAINLNQHALRRVVEEIFALLELALDGTIKHLPQALQQAAYRLLVPAESALRRLIVIAALNLKMKPPALKNNPLPKAVQGKNTQALSFQLYDTRKRFNRPPKILVPRIHVFSTAPLIPQFAPRAQKQNNANAILRRFAAFKRALENIPYQAKRLARWQTKRALKEKAPFRFPLRPGPPPGFRRSQRLDIDKILKECHHLASDALREAPS
jgi:hypothetical protein